MATGESYASITAGNEIFYEWRCQTCEENDCITEAVAYCRDCKECYCGSCLRDHNKFVSLRGHSILGEANKDDWGKSNISPVVSKDSGIECSDHKGQSISLYCWNHDDVCCPVCAFLKHGDVCKPKMTYIPSVAKGIGSSSELKDLMTTNKQLLSRIEQIEKKKSEGLSVVSISRKTCRKKVSDICQKYIARIKELERISITNVDKKHDDEEKNIQRDIDQCDEERLQLYGVKQQMQATHPINDSALFIQLKAGQKCHQRCKQLCESLNSRQMKTFEFHEDPDILQASLPKSLGECRESIPKIQEKKVDQLCKQLDQLCKQLYENKLDDISQNERKRIKTSHRSAAHADHPNGSDDEGRLCLPEKISMTVTEFFMSKLFGKYSKKGFKFTFGSDYLEYEGPQHYKTGFKTEFKFARSKLENEILMDSLDTSEIKDEIDVKGKEYEGEGVFLEYDQVIKEIKLYGVKWDVIQKVKQKFKTKFFPDVTRSRGARLLDRSSSSENTDSKDNGSQSKGTSNGGARPKNGKSAEHGGASASNFSWSLKTSNLEVYTVGKMTVKVYCADILEVPVDCIVIAANAQLQHKGGVAEYIAKAAGPKLKKERKAIIQKRGPLQVGEACSTTAGDLPYRYVIHTVGPCWSWYTPHDLAKVQKCEIDLAMAIRNSLSKAEELGQSSIAIPAVSAGQFGCPEELCAVQYARAVLAYTLTSRTPIQEVHVVDKNDAMVTEMHRVFNNVAKKGDIPKGYDIQRFVTGIARSKGLLRDWRD